MSHYSKKAIITHREVMVSLVMNRMIDRVTKNEPMGNVVEYLKVRTDKLAEIKR